MDHCTRLVCSVASEVIKVVQLVKVTNWERRTGTQGCGGAVPAASACAPCHRQKWNLAGWGRVAFGSDTELEFWGYQGNFHFVLASCATVRKAF